MLSGLYRNLATKNWLVDLPLIALAWLGAFWLRFNLEPDHFYWGVALRTMPIALACMATGLLLARVPHQSWRYVSLADLRMLALGIAMGAVLTAAVVLGLRLGGFPRSVFLIAAVLTLVLLSGARASWRTLIERERALDHAGAAQQPLLVIGTLEEADQALRGLRGMAAWRVAGVLTPTAADVGGSLHGVRVLGTVEALTEIAAERHTSTVLLASAPGATLRREVLMRWAGSGLNLLTWPAADELLRPGVVANPRRVRLEDLLGRTPVELDARGLAELFSGQTVLVTGAGGSIGAELCRQVARLGAARLVCVDVSEYAIYRLGERLRRSFPDVEGVYYTANVRDLERLRAIAQAHKPGVVLHAAAYKHVPLMEAGNEIEALQTNVLGTLHAARVAGEVGALRFVLVSTDKAVNPTSVMGASKRLAEQVVQAAAGAWTSTRFVAVRFGNVLGSSGSVVPLFEQQIARGGPVTVTHPDVVRYFMTIPEAAQLVLQAGLMGHSGQIFVLEMGEPVKIVELARMLIRLSGKTEAEVPIAFTGLRPGEKLYEELLADDETTEPTPHPKLRVAKVAGVDAAQAGAIQAWIEGLGVAPEGGLLRAGLRQRVPEYHPGRQAS